MNARCLLTIVAVLSFVGRDALAQDRLFLDGSELGALGRFGEPLGPAHGLDGTLAGGGRFLVPETFAGETDVIDLRTGARRPLPSGANVAAVDPARPTLILWLPGTGGTGTFDIAVYDIVSGAMETVLTRSCASGSLGFVPSIAYAYDAQLVVTQRCSAPTVVEGLVSVDLTTNPRRVRQLPIGSDLPLGASHLAVSSDGQRLFVRTTTGFLTSRIDAYDLVSGTLVGSAAADGEMLWDDALDALVVISGGGFSDSTVNVFGRSVQHLATAVFNSRICRPRVQVSPHTGRIYVTTNGASNTGAQPTVVEVFAGAPLRSAGRAIVSPLGQSSCRGAMVRTAPGAPRHLRATVTGREVALDWANVGGASNFVLEAGVGPGRADLTAFLGPDSRATFTAVPSGVYYVRVRGGNEFGGGRPSAEVRVVVP